MKGAAILGASPKLLWRPEKISAGAWLTLRACFTVDASADAIDTSAKPVDKTAVSKGVARDG